MASNDFQRQYNSLDLNGRIALMRFIGGGILTPQAEEKVVTDWITQQYGAYATLLNRPDVKAVLTRAAREGWTQERIQTEIQRTPWWKTTDAAMRKFDLLEGSDPKEAKTQLDKMSSTIKSMIAQQGVAGQFTEARIAKLARFAVRHGVEADAIPKLVFNEIQYNPTHPVGQIGADMDKFKAQAAQYVLPLSDRAAFDWAKKIATGQATADGFDTYMRDQAKSKYGHLAAELDQGLTVKNLLDPQIQQTAQLLEIDPDQVNLLDPKYSPLVSYADPQGKVRTMSLSESARYVRGMDAYARTDGAKQAAASLTSELMSRFGQAAR